jgi:16S rRNA (uracil1498-N3)-methyltransferase
MGRPLVTTPRLHSAHPLGPGAIVPLDRARWHYLRTVLRLPVGAEVLAFNGRDGEWAAQLVADPAPGLRLHACTRPPAAEPGPILLLAPIRPHRLEWLIEKAVELGVAGIRPVLTERTVVRPRSSARLRARIVEAAEQCGRLTLPELADPVPLLAAVDGFAEPGVLALADAAGDAPPLLTLLQSARVAGFLIGPEGGLTPRERQALRRRPAVRPVSLGPRVLRAETAALHALACWSASGDQRAAEAAAPLRSSPERRPGSIGGAKR